MNRIKSIFVLILVIAIVIALPATAQVTALPCNVAASNGRIIRINVAPTAIADVDEFLIQDLAEQYKNDLTVGSITIHEVGYAQSLEVPEPFASSPKIDSKVIYNLKNGKKTQTLSADKFIISVAKGETKKLSKKWSFSLKLNISGSTPFKLNELGLEAAITYTSDVGTEYQGPPESSKYNSREYRVRYYNHSGTWEQKMYGMDGKTILDTRKGSFKEPSRYDSYSVDKTIS